jgi:thiosulfate/3-mercaptopyruvate sulfurtransferase
MCCGSRLSMLRSFVSAVLLLISPVCRTQFSGEAIPTSSALSIPQAEVIQPDASQRILEGKDRTTVLQVDSHVMSAQAHIPGADYAGPGSQDAGSQPLESKVASTPKANIIVIYRSCWPWNRCPNVGPAYESCSSSHFLL